MGWILANTETCTVLELFSLQRGVSPREVFLTKIQPFKDAGGLEGKAYAALVGAKLRHPDHRFLYEEDLAEGLRE